MLYVQHVDRESQDVDEVMGLADTPSEALDIFEENTYANYDYDRTDVHERLCDGNDVSIQPEGRTSFYVKIARA